MGMYNEVFANCPECSGQGYLQIGQIVLGFGGFNISNPEGLAEQLDEDDLRTLHERVKDETFVCQDCHHGFNPLVDSKKNLDRRVQVARELFTPQLNEEDY